MMGQTKDMKIYTKRDPYKKTDLKFLAETESRLINSNPFQTSSFKATTITIHKLVVSTVHWPQNHNSQSHK
jgi:hypothetical protein